MDVEPQILGDLLEGREIGDTGIVDEHRDRSQLLAAFHDRRIDLVALRNVRA